MPFGQRRQFAITHRWINAKNLTDKPPPKPIDRPKPKPKDRPIPKPIDRSIAKPLR